MGLSFPSCALTEEYFVMVGADSGLVPPDKKKQQGVSKAIQDRIDQYKKWLDSFEISYSSNFLKQSAYRKLSKEDLLMALPEKNRSCLPVLYKMRIKEISDLCEETMGKRPGNTTIKKWILSGDVEARMEKYRKRILK